jgi:hypothetical protein
MQRGTLAADGACLRTFELDCGKGVMRVYSKSLLMIVHLAIAGLLASAGAHAQTISGSPSLALKSGESIEVGNVYYVANCRSLLKSTPEVEILDGPPGVTATIKEAMVLPRRGNCANRVPGGTLVLTAKDIEDPSYGALTVRLTFNTKDGERKFSRVYNVSLLP